MATYLRVEDSSLAACRRECFTMRRVTCAWRGVLRPGATGQFESSSALMARPRRRQQSTRSPYARGHLALRCVQSPWEKYRIQASVLRNGDYWLLVSALVRLAVMEILQQS